MKSEHVQWSRDLFNNLNENGVWAVPRSGLVFQRRRGGLYLIERMPWNSSFPVPKKEMTRYQLSDFDAISGHMVAAGIMVVDETGLKGGGDGDPPN